VPGSLEHPQPTVANNKAEYAASRLLRRQQTGASKALRMTTWTPIAWRSVLAKRGVAHESDAAG